MLMPPCQTCADNSLAVSDVLQALSALNCDSGYNGDAMGMLYSQILLAGL